MTEHGDYSFVVEVSEELHELGHQYSGRNALNNSKQRFIPLQRLESFWDDRKIERVVGLSAHFRGSIVLRPALIRTRFLRVYSLLVVIDHPELIEKFTSCDLDDEVFPLETFPSKWIKNATNKTLFEIILENQWAYFPVIFEKGRLYSQVLSAMRILPIEHEEIIRAGTEVALFRASLEASSTTFAAPENGKVKVVRKQYLGTKRKAMFERERKAFETLQSRPCKHIVECYGSFVQRKPDGELSFSLILEHFGAGNLDEFFQRASPPQDKTQLINFWKSFRGLFIALHTIHSTDVDSHHVTPESQIVHQDIKPQNILISLGSLDNDQKPLLKIIDFGYSFTRLSPQTHFIELGGSQAYGPPECSHHGQWRNEIINSITTEADMWSAGCVMSEAAAWVAVGQPLRHSYERARAAEAEQRKSFKDAGHGGCFHDGTKRLATVDSTHENITNMLPSYDDITPRVLALINESMLVRRQARKDAWEIREDLGKIIEKAFPGETTQPGTPVTPAKSQSELGNNTQTSPVPLVAHIKHTDDTTGQRLPPTPPPAAQLGTPPRNLLSPNTPPPSSPSAPPGQVGPLSVGEAAKYIRDKKDKRPLDTHVKTVIQQLQDNLGCRDHLFFVDTSETMYEHRREVTETLRVYAYIAKLIDTDGIDAAFATTPRPRKFKTTTALLEALERQRWTSVAFENSFGTFIDSVIKNLPARFPVPSLPGLKKKQQSIFVLTDGRWGRSEFGACGVEGPISRLVAAMKDKKLGRTQVMIQFIRFGTDEHGIRRLDFLDRLRPYGMDIVDTKPYHYDVGAMFFGAINSEVDDDDDEGENPSAASPPPRSSLGNGNGRSFDSPRDGLGLDTWMKL